MPVYTYIVFRVTLSEAKGLYLTTARRSAFASLRMTSESLSE